MIQGQRGIGFVPSDNPPSGTLQHRCAKQMKYKSVLRPLCLGASDILYYYCIKATLPSVPTPTNWFPVVWSELTLRPPYVSHLLLAMEEISTGAWLAHLSGPNSDLSEVEPTWICLQGCLKWLFCLQDPLSAFNILYPVLCLENCSFFMRYCLLKLFLDDNSKHTAVFFLGKVYALLNIPNSPWNPVKYVLLQTPF